MGEMVVERWAQAFKHVTIRGPLEGPRFLGRSGVARGSLTARSRQSGFAVTSSDQGRQINWQLPVGTAPGSPSPMTCRHVRPATLRTTRCATFPGGEPSHWSYRSTSLWAWGVADSRHCRAYDVICLGPCHGLLRRRLARSSPPSVVGNKEKRLRRPYVANVERLRHTWIDQRSNPLLP